LHCLTRMNSYERELMRKRNRNNMILPSMCDPRVMLVLNYSALFKISVLCSRCHTSVDQTHQGLSFKVGRNMQYLHYVCYSEIEKYQEGLLKSLPRPKTKESYQISIYPFILDNIDFYKEKLNSEGYELLVSDKEFELIPMYL
jgi:hypothetical protein